MRTWILSLLFLLAGCGMPGDPLALQGGSVGNGGDDRPITANSAWFIGPAPISYCVEVASRFGRSRAQVRASLERVFEQWNGYLRGRGLQGWTRDRHGRRVPQLGLWLNMEYLPTCDGSQQITFYFGVENHMVRMYRHLADFHNPLSFAQRLSYDIEARSGRGFMWFQSLGEHSAARWDLPGALETMVSHEIGHMLGCSHVAGTIMDVDIVQDLRRHPTPMELATIDRQRILLVPNGLVRFLLHADELFVAPLRNFLSMGPRPTKGGLLGNVEMGTLSVRRDGREIDVYGLRETSRHGTGAPIFKMAYVDRKSGNHEVVSLRSELVTYAGYRWTPEGVEEPAMVQYNGDTFRVRVQLQNPRGEVTEELQL